MDPRDMTLQELKATRWPKKSPFGTARLPYHFPRENITAQNEGFTIKLSNNVLEYQAGLWNDTSNPEAIPTTTNPIVSENIVLKRRVETLTRTAAISEIEVQQLKAEIKEAKEILAQLEQLQ